MKLLPFLLSQHWARLIGALTRAANPRSARELARETGISLGGVQDIVRRLSAQGIVSIGGNGRVSLTLEDDERELWLEMMRTSEIAELRTRASALSGRVPTAVGWIDQTLRAVQMAKERR
ncbi:MAG: MarR family transcriptional regulator [Deltaproteobacteria bacterium]|nr:MarR family transcriptional regulator [Deltaproteobacteria bacterium]